MAIFVGVVIPHGAGRGHEQRKRGRLPWFVKDRLAVFVIDLAKSGHAAQIVNAVQDFLQSEVPRSGLRL